MAKTITQENLKQFQQMSLQMFLFLSLILPAMLLLPWPLMGKHFDLIPNEIFITSAISFGLGVWYYVVASYLSYRTKKNIIEIGPVGEGIVLLLIFVLINGTWRMLNDMVKINGK